MIQRVLNKLFGSSNDRMLKKLSPIVGAVNALEARFERMSDAELTAMTGVFMERLDKGEPLDDLTAEAFAVVREAAKRTVGMRHYDVQVIGAMVLHQGRIAEMKTGEGKTLAATMPVYLNALTRKGVHVVTVNDYLARRDAEWMGQIYGFLGMDVGVVVHGMSDTERKAAYAAHVSYGQNNEFGFDYLRDNLKFSLDDMVQRKHHYAIVDEVDSILIDEARTPLIISGPAEGDSRLYHKVNAIIPFLKVDEDYVVDEKTMAATLTDQGVEKVERRLGIRSLYEVDNIEIVHHVNTALRAHTLYKRDQHYLVEKGEVIIVDEFTGRKMPGRRWSDGLHQAVEAKEGLKVQEENQTLATITFQNYFRMYDKLAGMTGTADTEAEEFHKIYELDVLVIPTNEPLARADEEDCIYTNERGKYRAIIEDIRDCQERGQPVLVGTTSVEKNEFLADRLRREKIPFQILNAKNHGREADIIAQAGQLHAVTVSTNMAGRGTDIILGGNAEMLALEEVGTKEGPEYEAALAKHKVACAEGRKRVLELGGLRVVGTERHESRRIDNQLRGRSGRQGDPGSSRFYLSLDDELLRIFGGENLKKWMARFKIPEDEPIVHRWVTKVIESSQRKVEARNFDIRKNLLEYDDVMNQQRETMYLLRRKVLEGSEVHAWIRDAVADVAWSEVEPFCPENVLADEWDLDALREHMRAEWDLDVALQGEIDTSGYETIAEHIAGKLQEGFERRCKKIADQLYQLHAHEEGATPEAYWNRWLEYEQEQLLRAVDRDWRRHLQAIDHLREGIHLEAYGQQDPKVIYKKEAFEYFQSLLQMIKESITRILFRVELRDDAQIERLKKEREERARQLAAQAQEIHAQAESAVGTSSTAESGGGAPPRGPSSGPTAPIRRSAPKVGRNDPCPCGSGKKYKKCHMDQGQPAAP